MRQEIDQQMMKIDIFKKKKKISGTHNECDQKEESANSKVRHFEIRTCSGVRPFDKSVTSSVLVRFRRNSVPLGRHQGWAKTELDELSL